MNAFSDSQFSVRAYLKGKKIQISITSLVLIVFYSLDLRKYYISNTLMTQENKLERERENTVQNHVLLESVVRRSKRPRGGGWWTVRSILEEAPSLARKFSQSFSSETMCEQCECLLLQAQYEVCI